MPSCQCGNCSQQGDAPVLCRKGLPVFNKVEVTVDTLISQGQRLAQEQQMVNDHKLSEDYMKSTGPSQPGLIGLKG